VSSANNIRYDHECNRPTKRPRTDSNPRCKVIDQGPQNLVNSGIMQYDVNCENDVSSDETSSVKRTDLETALSWLETGEEAIAEYQKSQHVAGGRTPASLEDTVAGTGKSSIYIDAFRLALDTVLDQESHLFDDSEKAVFAEWCALSYEAQFL
jgi:fanconi-associated nuclease 1